MTSDNVIDSVFEEAAVSLMCACLMGYAATIDKLHRKAWDIDTPCKKLAVQTVVKVYGIDVRSSSDPSPP